SPSRITCSGARIKLRKNQKHRTKPENRNLVPSRGMRFSPFCFSLLLSSGTEVVACGGVFRDGTVRGHGWPRRAYRDVFTACPAPEHTSASTRHNSKAGSPQKLTAIVNNETIVVLVRRFGGEVFAIGLLPGVL